MLGLGIEVAPIGAGLASIVHLEVIGFVRAGDTFAGLDIEVESLRAVHTGFAGGRVKFPLGAFLTTVSSLIQEQASGYVALLALLQGGVVELLRAALLANTGFQVGVLILCTALAASRLVVEDLWKGASLTDLGSGVEVMQARAGLALARGRVQEVVVLSTLVALPIAQVEVLPLPRALLALVLDEVGVGRANGAGSQVELCSQLKSPQRVLLHVGRPVVPVLSIQIILVNGVLQVHQPGRVLRHEFVVRFTTLCVDCFVHDAQIILGLAQFQCDFFVTGATDLVALFQCAPHACNGHGDIGDLVVDQPTVLGI